MKIASLFSDHAVLQREISVPVWGWMKPKSRVQVKLGPYEARSLSGADGKFLVRLPPMKAGGPYKLAVSSCDSGEKASSSDIWIGEVWLASGQSNMEFCVSQTENPAELEELAADKNLRMIKIPCKAYAGRQSDVEASWQVADAKATGCFSAVGAHFAHQLSKALKMKVGIVNSSWGGTIIEAWTSRETLRRNPEQAIRLAAYEDKAFSKEFWAATGGVDLSEPSARESCLKEEPCFPKDPGNEAVKRGWARTDCDDSAWNVMMIPSAWTDCGHKFSGVFWFRKTVSVPAKWAGKDLLLSIGAVDKTEITYFNGEKVGAMGHGLDQSVWNIPRDYIVPGHLVKAGRNVIAVRAFSFIYDGGMIGPADKMKLRLAEGRSQEIPLSGAWKYAVEHNFGFVPPPAGMAPGPGCQNSFGILFDNMIAPLLPYAIRGALWYQGESNANNAAEYERLQRDLIRDWRFAWGQGDFPFYIVQLANFARGFSFEAIREAELNALSEPNTGMAVAIDIGDSIDIHPKNKKEAGIRLSLWALNDLYGISCEVSGPLYKSATIEGSAIRLRFSHVGGGLVVKGGKLKTFEVSDGVGPFEQANAVIEGDSVVVSSVNVKKPMAVRYAWSPDPLEANLYNKAGLPASPFRTMKGT